LVVAGEAMDMVHVVIDGDLEVCLDRGHQWIEVLWVVLAEDQWEAAQWVEAQAVLEEVQEEALADVLKK
jgi:hypothetical protein